MENSDVFGSSTAPLTWHDFLERMRHPSAAEFVKAIKSFIVSFLNNAPDEERDGAAVQDFLGNMEVAFRAHSLWAGSSEEELESAGEGLEKYVMTKLFTRVFASIPEDVKADEQLHEKMALVQQFIRPEHLDIKPTFQNETSWLLAQKELQKINMYKAPRDKLVCILNCCKVISNLLVNASLASKGDHPGADEFLPVLIYVTIKANPPQLHSNLSYIQRFRRQTRLVAESAYFFTNMLSVESFIMNMDSKALSMDESEFENNMESAKQLLFGLSENSDVHSQADQNFEPLQGEESMEPKPLLSSRRHQGPANTIRDHVESSKTKSRINEQDGSDTSSSLNKIPSISDLENRGAGMLLKEDEVSRVFQDFPFLYSQAGDLTVGDVEDLLGNYKQLVFKYVSLAKGLGVTNPSPSPSLPNSQHHNLEQPEAAKEPENITDHAIDNTKNDPPSVASESPKSSDAGPENTEPKMLEKTAPAPQAEEGNENQNPQ
ncbi:vacuolar protein sorting-associated protein 9A-like isoform X1 [Salvia hispanica]|uniref:vacuolar protein sorting-associated protein 9A-like isoform X1 n=2 Tax=Salvia hispanica TaxID=49212 RepID=UPI0020092F15|nr:vacuolar protein sorting-associated protein 9A-like isoform X1 [Salvia hispanica]XP_047975195.1 vacuolar protein sorting-associated protein 9A-like isoform X1 [Salvia hispanica]